MHKLVAAVLSVAALGAASTTQAANISLSVGQTGDSAQTYRLGMQFDFNKRWLESDVGHLGGYWDAAYTYWDADDTSGNNSISLAPVLVYEFNGDTIRPYAEAGIGGAFFSQTEIDDSAMSTSFQFESHIGAGIRFSGQEIGVRAYHYSNASIKQPNDGVENYALHYRLSF
ncbi:Lipid A deacylase PagL [Pseudomonas marincola]|jgi:lipid A 3-O-deacylase|uniref:Lipid A deacylase PagL n=1 Tax=Pseudomonas marincola TaxID=437900 RepID=A0A1I7DXZ2_9PSED|nr:MULTISPECIES: acyloxyacyl hydrolase [Pseudomonas]MAB98158.1 acyloxyacyl hydrolase [Pseudomonadaceae bacterium]CAE6894021.1 Lipid A deacylase PagL [Pseudomonas marincola]SFU16548.1 lipid A 3-O-deacylase [Pseudomonas marincola]